MRGALLALAALAGCFSPEPRDGLPCSQAGDCPDGQTCQVGICSSGMVPDATPLDGGDDAGPPPPPGDFEQPALIALVCPGAVVCADAREPFLRGETLVFSSVVATPAGNQDIYYATRTGLTTFTQAASIGGVNTTIAEYSPFLSADGTSLLFAQQDLSSGVPVRPYAEILLSKGEAGAFATASDVPGGVDTLLGDERSPQVSSLGDVLLFTRAPETEAGDHDVYLARQGGGQWNTIERIDALSAAGSDERSIALVEERQAVFYIRDDQIHEALWVGDGPSAVALDVVHAELDAAPLDKKVGVWASADGTEIWFDSNRSGAQLIYYSTRPLPTSSGGRIRRRPIP